MTQMGIHGKLYRWIKYFLIDRTIQTKTANTISSKEVLEEGLPQGSSLSCTLFLIYLNDMPEIIKAEKALYADDLVFWTTHDNINICTSKTNADLKALNEYSQRWKLRINCTKSVYTIFTKSHKIGKLSLRLKLKEEYLPKEEFPVYLGVQLDRQLTLKKHVQSLRSKANRRLQLLKKLASSSWGSDKLTLRGLYLGYVRSALEYSNIIITTTSKTNVEALDRIQNNALRFINGGMRSTPTAACEILTDVEPLGLRRDKAALEIYERNIRMNVDDPNKKLIDKWRPQYRLKQKSILHHISELQEKHHLPENRAKIQRINKNLPPHATYKLPLIKVELADKTDKSYDPTSLMLSAFKTIDQYPENWIHAYTDGSAFKATTKAGYGTYIQHSDGTTDELSSACGEKCSNYEAEIAAVETALYHLRSIFSIFPSKINNIVIFTDSKSLLQVLHHNPHNIEMNQITMESHKLMDTFGINITMQWIPGHTNIPGNERADSLAKRGSQEEQPNTASTLHTAKQIIRANAKEEWMNRWAMGTTGRTVFKYMNSPKPKDNINKLTRKDQTIIFRLRTNHVPLNMHLNRIQPQHPPMCLLCMYPYETVHHHLFECPPLGDLRTLLPPNPDPWNTLYGTKQQMEATSSFFRMAKSRRARAQMQLDR